MRLVFAVVAAVLVAAPATAQISISPAEPASAGEIAAARAEADRLIAAAQAGDVFENVSEGREPRARHRRSGMVCRFRMGEEQSLIMVFPSPVPRGDDVGCNVGSGDTYRSIYATRYGALSVSPQDAMDIAVYQIQQRYPEAQPWDQPVVTVDRQGAAPSRVAAFRVGASYTHVMLSEVGEWSIKERLTLPEAPSMEAQLFNNMIWSITLGDVVEAQAD